MKSKAKKKIVFVIPSLDAGGGEKSLINLLNTIDYSRFEVDLVLFSPKGLFLKLLPETVNIISLSKNHTIFSKGLLSAVLQFLLSGNLALAYHRIVFAYKNKKCKNKAIAEQKSWKNKKHSFNELTDKYDVAIAFLEKSSIYFCVDKIKADKKIGWIHTNYSNSGMNKNFDKPYFYQLNEIITVSEECKTDLQNNFPEFKHKIHLIHNIVSSRLIKSLAEQNIENFQSILSNIPTIITVGRLSYEKGIDIAVETSKLLKENGVSFKWVVIGDGLERENIEKQINKNQLQEYFILLGLKQNPYPYIKMSTIYVQPSRYEGKSIAIDEAKILQKPIIVSDFDTAKDQIKHQYNGIISSKKPEQLAIDIQMLLEDKLRLSEFSLHLSQENFGTEDEINKLYKLIK